jgi:hypothetical protein
LGDEVRVRGWGECGGARDGVVRPSRVGQEREVRGR